MNFKNIARTGLSALLAAALAGCATVQTIPSTYQQQIRGPTRIENSRTESVQTIQYSIDNIQQDMDRLLVGASQKGLEYRVKKGTQVTTIYDVTYSKDENYEITPGMEFFNILSTLMGGSQPFERGVYQSSGGLREISRRFLRDERKDFSEDLGSKELYASKPASQALVRVNTKEFGANSAGITDGVASVRIVMPRGFDVSEERLTSRVREEDFLSLTNLGWDVVRTPLGSAIKKASRNIELETYTFGSKEDSGYKHDKKSFSLEGYKVDYDFLNGELEIFAKQIIEERLSPYKTLNINVFDEDTHEPLSDATIRFRKVEGISRDEIANRRDRIVEEYCKNPSGNDFCRQLNVPVESLIYDLDGMQAGVNGYGTQLKVNVPSQYEVEVTGYNRQALVAKVNLTPKIQGNLKLYLPKVADRVRFDSGNDGRAELR